MEVLRAAFAAVCIYLLIFAVICLLAGYGFLAWSSWDLLLYFDRRFTSLIAWLIFAFSVVASGTLWVTGWGKRWRPGAFILVFGLVHLAWTYSLRYLPEPKAITASLITFAADLRIRHLDWQPYTGAAHRDYLRQHLGRRSINSPDRGILHFRTHGLIFRLELDTRTRPAKATVSF